VMSPAIDRREPIRNDGHCAIDAALIDVDQTEVGFKEEVPHCLRWCDVRENWDIRREVVHQC
jgi:hypothetical protein